MAGIPRPMMATSTTIWPTTWTSLPARDAAAEAELCGLFADHAWLHARVPQSRYLYDGYLADLEAAWRRANAEVYRESEDSTEFHNPRPLRKIRNHPNQHQCPG